MITDFERPQFQPLRLFWMEVKERKATIIRTILLTFSAFFLAQAVLFDAAVPFFLPMWAFTRFFYRKDSMFVLVGGLMGSFMLSLGQVVIHVLQLLLFHKAIQQPLAQKSVPMTVALCMLAIQLPWQLMMHAGKMPIEVYFFIGFEVVLSFFITLFLFYAFETKDTLAQSQWTVERLSAACIVVVMAFTGMSGMVIGQVDVRITLIHLLILYAALVGNLSIATVVGMIIALVVGLSELTFTGMMALYSMTGFVAGALGRLGKFGIAVGVVFTTCFFFMYDASLPIDQVYFTSLTLSLIVFFATPMRKIKEWRMVFQQEQDEPDRQTWIENRLQEQLGNFQEFTNFLSTIIYGRDEKQKGQQTHASVPSICQSCFRYESCWNDQVQPVEELMEDWLHAFTTKNLQAQQFVEEKLKYKCIRYTGLISELETEGVDRLLNRQMQHGRQILALQLRDMSKHLDEVMSDIQGNLAAHHSTEEALMKRIEQRDIECFQIDILKEEPGNKRIVCSLPEKKASFESNESVAKQLIIPILEEYFNEPFKIQRSTFHVKPFRHVQVVLQSSVRFSFEYGVTRLSNTSSFRSGDAYEVFSLHDGLSAILLSDGMGQDIKAYHESRKVIQLMRECLHQKMSPETAMHTLYYMMSLNNLEDMYATLDLALIDLQKGTLWSWKAGSMSTYIMRGDQVLRIDSQDAPVGILSSPTIEAKDEQLKAGDIVVMLTDGIFQSTVSLELQEQALYNILKRYKEESCEVISEKCVQQLEEQFQASGDDRTVLVLKVSHALPKWLGFSPSQVNG